MYGYVWFFSKWPKAGCTVVNYGCKSWERSTFGYLYGCVWSIVTQMFHNSCTVLYRTTIWCTPILCRQICSSVRNDSCLGTVSGLTFEIFVQFTVFQYICELGTLSHVNHLASPLISRWRSSSSHQAEWGVPPFHQKVAWIQILVRALNNSTIHCYPPQMI